jgi:hypothetical protein
MSDQYTKPRIPLEIESIPQHRMHEMPPSFKCICDYDLKISPNIRPRHMPRSAKFLGMVEWSWSPMHSRLDAYYLSTNMARSHWFLWVRRPNEWADWTLSPLSEVRVFAYGPKKGVPPKVAAIHLIRAFWIEGKTDRYDMVSEEGLLSVDEIEAIADSVWGNLEQKDNPQCAVIRRVDEDEEEAKK